MILEKFPTTTLESSSQKIDIQKIPTWNITTHFIKLKILQNTLT